MRGGDSWRIWFVKPIWGLHWDADLEVTNQRIYLKGETQ